MSDDTPSLGGWPDQLRSQAPRQPVRSRQPTPWPSGRHPVDEVQTRLMDQVVGSMPTSPAPCRWLAVRPVADELWRIGTDPYTGVTRVHRYQLSIGCAAGLLAELMIDTRPEVIPGCPERPVLATFAQDGTGRPMLSPDMQLYHDDPPRDPLLHQVLSEIVKDGRDTRRPVAEYVEYLAETAYMRVAERLVIDRYLVEGQRRMWPSGRRRRIWTAVEPTASLNAMNRLPRELNQGAALSLADRVLLGLLGAVDLVDLIRHEYGRRCVWPEHLRLPDRLRQVVNATQAVVAVAARRAWH